MLHQVRSTHGRQQAQWCSGKAARRSSRRAVSVTAAHQQHSWQHAKPFTPSSTTSTSSQSWLDRARAIAGAAATAAVLVAGPMLPAPLMPSAAAADAAKVGGCLLRNCQKELAQCIADPNCAQNLVCLNACSLSPDEAACQIKCGDKYEDKAVDVFNSCAVSEKKCVPQRVDKDVYPVPPDCALDTKFDLSGFTGRWYITAGLNPLFDTFDCQVHFFVVPSPGNLVGKINWRINKSNGDFIERSTMQMFKQDPNNPAIMYNHGNEYLHYEDDWYILASKPNEYILIYYRGKNDAWDGYGGATVYTRAPKLPEKYIPELSAAAEAAGLTWADFKVTDNSCGPHPPNLVQTVEEDIEGSLTSFGKGFTVIKDVVNKEEQVVEEEVKQVERVVEQEVKEAEAKILELEKEFADEIASEERELSKDLSGFINNLKNIFRSSPKQAAN